MFICNGGTVIELSRSGKIRAMPTSGESGLDPDTVDF